MDDAVLTQALAGRRISAVVIGASAGGVSALIELLPGLPREFACPVVTVLHVMRARQNQPPSIAHNACSGRVSSGWPNRGARVVALRCRR